MGHVADAVQRGWVPEARPHVIRFRNLLPCTLAAIALVLTGCSREVNGPPDSLPDLPALSSIRSGELLPSVRSRVDALHSRLSENPTDPTCERRTGDAVARASAARDCKTTVSSEPMLSTRIRSDGFTILALLTRHLAEPKTPRHGFNGHLPWIRNMFPPSSRPLADCLRKVTSTRASACTAGSWADFRTRPGRDLDWGGFMLREESPARRSRNTRGRAR